MYVFVLLDSLSNKITICDTNFATIYCPKYIRPKCVSNNLNPIQITNDINSYFVPINIANFVSNVVTNNLTVGYNVRR